MIDIWKYRSGNFIKLTDVDGKIYFGQVLEVWDKEEFEDEDSDRLDLVTKKMGYMALDPMKSNLLKEWKTQK